MNSKANSDEPYRASHGSLVLSRLVDTIAPPLGWSDEFAAKMRQPYVPRPPLTEEQIEQACQVLGKTRSEYEALAKESHELLRACPFDDPLTKEIWQELFSPPGSTASSGIPR